MIPGPDESLKQHIRVNSIADYYNIPDLATLSTQKAKESCGRNWNATQFLTAVKTVPNMTGQGGLQVMLADQIAQHMDELLEHDEFKAIVGDFSFSILRKHAELAKGDSLRQQQNSLQATQNRMFLDASNMRTCINTLNYQNDCRNCGSFFTCYIDELEGENCSSFILRCQDCLCRHYPRSN